MDKDTTIISEEYQSMLKKNTKLEDEIEILKKTMVIFARILDIPSTNKKRYSAPKIHKNLEVEDINISLKRTQRIMCKLGIRSIFLKNVNTKI